MVLSQIIITDLAAIAILLISALHGRRRGFIKTISGLLALVLAFFLSSTLANATTPHISEKYVAPYINQAIEKEPQAEAAATPENLSNLFSEIGIPEAIVSDAIADISDAISQSIIKPITAMTHTVAYKITYAVLFIIYFVISLILLKLLMKVVNLASKIPGVNFLNKTFGLILGLISGYLIISILSFILVQTGFYLTPALISETTVLKFITSFSPLAFLSF